VTNTDVHGNFDPVLNFANQASQCHQSKGAYICPEVEEDIKICQLDKKKTILLSFGGGKSPERGFDNEDKARIAAQKLWDMFGPAKGGPQDDRRPFGNAAVDGFDFDFENDPPGLGWFGEALYRVMNGENTGQRYITAAPQCPPLSPNSELNKTPLDMVFIQFYNNPQCEYNFETWNQWASNKGARWFLGLPASKGALDLAILSQVSKLFFKGIYEQLVLIADLFQVTICMTRSARPKTSTTWAEPCFGILARLGAITITTLWSRKI
jgi:chitinase